MRHVHSSLTSDVCGGATLCVGSTGPKCNLGSQAQHDCQILMLIFSDLFSRAVSAERLASRATLRPMGLTKRDCDELSARGRSGLFYPSCHMPDRQITPSIDKV